MQITLTRRKALALIGAATPTAVFGANVRFELPVRSRVEIYKGSAVWRTVGSTEQYNTSRSAMLICDMWDRHWCGGATKRVGEMTKRMAATLALGRSKGMQVIHAPSDVMDFYETYPQRQFMKQFAGTRVESGLNLVDPPLPIDDKAGGCDTGESFYKAWKRQHADIPVEANDVISDKGNEIFGLLKLRGIDTLFVMGVHTNMCILNRTFAIKQMTKWGMRCVLLRDLTDSMYDPKQKPFVSHDEGTALVIEHIERYWCPSALSADLERGLS